MPRRFVFTLICIALPFALYALYERTRSGALAKGRDPWPMTVLWLTGAVLAIEAMVVTVLQDGGLE
jgi:hypothetical protein